MLPTEATAWAKGLERTKVLNAGGMDGGPPAETQLPGDGRSDLELAAERFWALCEVWCPPASRLTAPRWCSKRSEQPGPPVRTQSWNAQSVNRH